MPYACKSAVSEWAPLCTGSDFSSIKLCALAARIVQVNGFVAIYDSNHE